jgi:RNase P/RNase MRP subunit p29
MTNTGETPAANRMWAADDDVQRDASECQAVPAVGHQLNVTQRSVEASTTTVLSVGKRIPKPMGPRKDFGAQLERMQTVVVAWDAHRWDAELSKRARDAEPTHLGVAGQVPDEEEQIVAGAVEETDVLVVPVQMNIADHTDGGRLRDAVVHGTKLSRRSATREREEINR